MKLDIAVFVLITPLEVGPRKSYKGKWLFRICYLFLVQLKAFSSAIPSPCCIHWCCLQHLHHCGQILTSCFWLGRTAPNHLKVPAYRFLACQLQWWWLKVCPTNSLWYNVCILLNNGNFAKIILILGFSPIPPLTPSFCPPQMKFDPDRKEKSLTFPLEKNTNKFSRHNYSYCHCIKMGTFEFLYTLLLNKYWTKVKL